MRQLSVPDSAHLLRGWQQCRAPAQQETLPGSAGLAALGRAVLAPTGAHRAQGHGSAAGQPDPPGIASSPCTHGAVWKPSKRLMFLQPGPPPAGPGFWKPRLGDPAPVNRGGTGNTEYGVIGKRELPMRA